MRPTTVVGLVLATPGAASPAPAQTGAAALKSAGDFSAMAWQGKSLGQICEQIKDPARNGKRTLKQIHDHMAFDELVGWGWHPGGARTPAPGTQKQFGELVAAWSLAGAAVPQREPLRPWTTST